MAGKAFVTGGSGFVGRELIAALVRGGTQVVALARSDAAAAAVAAAGAEAVRGDLDDRGALAAGMRGASVVYHSAAKVEQYGKRADFERVNAEGTRNVVEAARAAGVKRAVHISTEAVLCGGPLRGVDETQPYPVRPVGLYAETKGAAERIVLAANRDGLETVIIRPRFIWGKGDTTLLPQLAAAVRRGQFRWVGGGRYSTSTCHVRNVVEGALLAAARGKPGEIYFLTDGKPQEFRAFMTRMLATQGVTAPAKDLPRWLARPLAVALETSWRLFSLRGQPPITPMVVRLIGGEVTVVDDKARRELGYTSSVSIDDGLAELSPAARPEGNP
jgi:nucleoside-diphosphate-sugar epimerase